MTEGALYSLEGTRCRLHGIGQLNQDDLRCNVPEVRQDNTLGGVEILELERELESSVYSKKRVATPCHRQNLGLVEQGVHPVTVPL